MKKKGELNTMHSSDNESHISFDPDVKFLALESDDDESLDNGVGHK